MPAGTLTLNVKDHSDELSGFSVRTAIINSANFDTVISTTIPDLVAATETITHGRVATATLSIPLRFIPRDFEVTDTNAQRERKALVDFGQLAAPFGTGQVEIPTIKNSYLIPRSELYDLADADIAAWIAAFTAIARDRNSGGVIEVFRMTQVGRNI